MSQRVRLNVLRVQMDMLREGVVDQAVALYPDRQRHPRVWNGYLEMIRDLDVASDRFRGWDAYEQSCYDSLYDALVNREPTVADHPPRPEEVP